MTTSTFTWFGGSGLADVGTNWTPVGPPGPGDTALIHSGTVFMALDAQLNSNTIDIGSATLSFVGDSILNYTTPTLDNNTTIVSTGTVATTTQLIAAGTFVNQGTIDANGSTGSSFTIDVTTNGTAPGYFMNDGGEIAVEAGNSMTINIAGTSELFNASDIQVNGGSLFINAATNAIAGGYAPVGGIAVIVAGGRLETNVNYGTSVGGVAPYYAFGDATPGNTLKIDNIGSFGGVIVGFGAGDTIDLGTSLAVGTLVYNGTSSVLALENAGGTILASLLVSGNFQTGTAALSGGSALGFNVGTVGGDTVLTTAVQNFVASNTSGVWQDSTTWAAIPGGVPGTADSAFIGLNATSPFVVTTGSSAVQIGNLNLVDKALLQITSSTTAGPTNINAFGGTLEVTSGNTLTAPGMRMFGATVEVDPTAVLDLTGHSITSLAAVNGTLAVQSGNTSAVRLYDGDLLVNGGTLNAGTGQSGGNGGNILIGFDGGGTPGVVTVQNSGTNAGVVTDTYAIVSSDPTSFGILTLNGNVSWTDQIDPHDTATTRGYMLIGNNNEAGNTPAGVAPAPFTNAATLVVENGATLTEQTYAEIGASFDSAGSVLVSSNALWNIGTATGGYLDVGLRGAGALTVDGGTVEAGNVGTFFSNGTSFTGGGIGIGISAGASGTLTVENGGQVITAGGMAVGRGTTLGANATGTLDVLSGGTVVVTGSGNGLGVGKYAGATGTMLVSGTNALVTLGTATGGITVGVGGQGTLDVASGGSIQLHGTGGILLGQSIGATGILDITGPNALVTLGTTDGGITVGSAGQGTLDIESGGTIQMDGTGGIGVGMSLGSGLMIVNGPNALLDEGTASKGITVGGTGQGTLDVASGGTIQMDGTGGILLGLSIGATGILDITGPNALVTLGTTFGPITVGSAGQGTLDIESGGTIQMDGTGGIGVGVSSGSGLIIVNGPNALLNDDTASQGITVGQSGNGVLSISNGGSVASIAGVTVGSSGTLEMGGGILSAGGTLLVNGVANGGVVNGFGTLNAFLNNTGSVTASGGRLIVNGGLSGIGFDTIAGGATLEAGGTIGSSQSVNFATSAAQAALQLDTLSSFTQGFGLSNWQRGDELIIANGVTVDSAVLTGSTLAVITSGGTYDFTNVTLAVGAPTTFNIVGTNVVELACFVTGTLIDTDFGTVPVEALREGDRVKTALGGAAEPIVWIGHRTVDCAHHPRPRLVWPVRISAGAFGPGVPRRDLWLSPDHAVFFGGVLIPVKYLVNGSSIAQVATEAVTYWHVELPRHAVLLAEGLPAESYLDVGDRANFANGGASVALYPDFASRVWEATGCAPLVVTGPELEAARRRVNARAMAPRRKASAGRR